MSTDINTLRTGILQKLKLDVQFADTTSANDTINEYLTKRMGARGYQTRWIEDIITRTDKQDKVYVCFAPTGAGKTMTKKFYTRALDKIHGTTKSFNTILIPSTSQDVLAKFHDDVIDELPADHGVLFSSRFSNKVRSSDKAFIYNNNPYSFAKWAKSKKHIISFSSHKFFRDHIVGLFQHESGEIIKDRKLIGLIDEIHSELHTDGTDSTKMYTENTENHEGGYSGLGLSVMDTLISFGFTVTGFTGTPSRQQCGLTKFDGVFIYNTLARTELNEVQSKNTYLDKVTKIKIEIKNRKADQEKHQKEFIEAIQEDVYDRPGISIVYLKYHHGATAADEYDVDKFDEKISPHFPKDSILYWFGGDDKYCFEKRTQSDGTIVYRKQRFWKGKSIYQVLKSYPKIKLITVQKLLDKGFDYPDVNTIIFSKPVVKETTFLTEQQQIGRGVRVGQVGLRIIFTSQKKKARYESHYESRWRAESTYLGFGSCERLISQVLERGTILSEANWSKEDLVSKRGC